MAESHCDIRCCRWLQIKTKIFIAGIRRDASESQNKCTTVGQKKCSCCNHSWRLVFIWRNLFAHTTKTIMKLQYIYFKGINFRGDFTTIREIKSHEKCGFWPSAKLNLFENLLSSRWGWQRRIWRIWRHLIRKAKNP